MEASRHLPEGTPEIPQVDLQKEILEDGTCLYRFFVDGEESCVTMTRDDTQQYLSDYTYRLLFFDWQFAEADVHHNPGITSVEWQGITEGLADLAEIQASKLLGESAALLATAVREDFPGTSIEDAVGNPL